MQTASVRVWSFGRDSERSAYISLGEARLPVYCGGDVNDVAKLYRKQTGLTLHWADAEVQGQ
jgi:hypothetical protein